MRVRMMRQTMRLFALFSPLFSLSRLFEAFSSRSQVLLFFFLLVFICSYFMCDVCAAKQIDDAGVSKHMYLHVSAKLWLKRRKKKSNKTANNKTTRLIHCHAPHAHTLHLNWNHADKQAFERLLTCNRFPCIHIGLNCLIFSYKY